MNFQELLLAAIESSEIPLRFEPGAPESVAKPVIEMLQSVDRGTYPTGFRIGIRRGVGGAGGAATGGNGQIIRAAGLIILPQSSVEQLSNLGSELHELLQARRLMEIFVRAQLH